MKHETVLLLIGLFLFYEYSKQHANPQPGDPNFVGPVQGTSSQGVVLLGPPTIVDSYGGY